MKSGVFPEPVLVGRDKEIEELQQCLDNAFRGIGSTVFVSGGAGIGKTRLVNEFLNASKQKNVRVLAGWCLSNSAVPYFPFMEAFESYSYSNESLESQQLVKTLFANKPEKQNVFENMGAQVWKDQTFAAVLKELLLMATKEPLIFFIEDIHWADSASLSLIHYISRGIRSERIMFIATFRSEEISGRKIEGKSHPLVETLRLMGREGIFKEIMLRNLSQNEVGKIVESILGGSVNANFVQKLSSESGGEPLFVVESLRMIFENGSFFHQDGSWQLSTDKLGIPSKVKDIILHRLNTLTFNQRKTLDVASVMGDKFDAQLIAAVLNVNNLEVLETLTSIALSKSLVCVEGDHYKFDHAKTREVIYDEILLPLRNGYHEKIAETIESSNLKTEKLSLSELAYHYTQAGNKTKSLEYNLAAGKESLAKFSNTEAIKYFTYAVQRIPETFDQIEKKTIALEGLGDAFYGSCLFNEAIKTFEQLAAIQKGVVKLRALRKAMFGAYYQGDILRLKALTDEAEENATADRLESARVIHQKARVIGIQGQIATSLRLNEEALKVFEEEYALPEAAWSLFVVGYLASCLGQWEKGIASVLRSIALYNDLGDFRSQMEAYYYAGLSFQNCMLIQEACNMFLKVVEVDEQLNMGDYIQLIPTYTFWGLGIQFVDLDGAISKTSKALECSEKTDSYLYLGLVYEAFVFQYLVAGDMIRAEQYFKKLFQLPKDVFLNGFTQTFLVLVKAAYYAGRNQFEESNRYFEEHFKLIKSAPLSFSVEVFTKQIYAWCLNRQGRFKEGNAEVEQVQKLVNTYLKKFEHINVQASLIAPIRAADNRPFEIRLDLVNVSSKASKVVGVDNIIPSGFKVVNLSEECRLYDGSIEWKENVLGPFSIKSITLGLQATESGSFKLEPRVRYIDDLGQTKIADLKPVRFSVTTAPATVVDPKASLEIEEGKVEFKSEVAQKAFDFLVKAFKEDYLNHKHTQENSGWRTLMEVAKQGQVSKHSMYGRSRGGGQAKLELTRLGLIETRYFSGERGRGGHIQKVRVRLDVKKIKQLIGN